MQSKKHQTAPLQNDAKDPSFAQSKQSGKHPRPKRTEALLDPPDSLQRPWPHGKAKLRFITAAASAF